MVSYPYVIAPEDHQPVVIVTVAYCFLFPHILQMLGLLGKGKGEHFGIRLPFVEAFPRVSRVSTEDEISLTLDEGDGAKLTFTLCLET